MERHFSRVCLVLLFAVVLFLQCSPSSASSIPDVVVQTEDNFEVISDILVVAWNVILALTVLIVVVLLPVLIVYLFLITALLGKNGSTMGTNNFPVVMTLISTLLWEIVTLYLLLPFRALSGVFTAARNIISEYNLIIGFLALWGLILVWYTYQPTIMQTIDQVYTDGVHPIYNGTGTVLANISTKTYETGVCPWNVFWITTQTTTRSAFNIALTCGNYNESFFLLVEVIIQFNNASLNWLADGIVQNEFNLNSTALTTGEFVFSWRDKLSCMCPEIEVFWNYTLQPFTFPSVACAADRFFNAWLSFFIRQPLDALFQFALIDWDPSFDILCQGFECTATWVDDILSFAITQVAGSSAPVPPIGCMFSKLICAYIELWRILTSAAVNVTQLILAQITLEEYIDTYYDFDHFFAILLDWAECLRVAWSAIQTNLGCLVGAWARFMVNVFWVIVGAARHLIPPTRIFEMVPSPWVPNETIPYYQSVRYDIIFGNATEFFCCVGDVFSLVYDPLGCIVCYGVNATLQIPQLLLNTTFHVDTLFADPDPFITELQFDKFFEALNITAECAGDFFRGFVNNATCGDQVGVNFDLNVTYSVEQPSIIVGYIRPFVTEGPTSCPQNQSLKCFLDFPSACSFPSFCENNNVGTTCIDEHPFLDSGWLCPPVVCNGTLDELAGNGTVINSTIGVCNCTDPPENTTLECTGVLTQYDPLIDEVVIVSSNGTCFCEITVPPIPAPFVSDPCTCNITDIQINVTAAGIDPASNCTAYPNDEVIGRIVYENCNSTEISDIASYYTGVIENPDISFFSLNNDTICGENYTLSCFNGTVYAYDGASQVTEWENTTLICIDNTTIGCPAGQTTFCEAGNLICGPIQEREVPFDCFLSIWNGIIRASSGCDEDENDFGFILANITEEPPPGLGPFKSSYEICCGGPDYSNVPCSRFEGAIPLPDEPVSPFAPRLRMGNGVNISPLNCTATGLAQVIPCEVNVTNVFIELGYPGLPSEMGNCTELVLLSNNTFQTLANCSDSELEFFGNATVGFPFVCNNTLQPCSVFIGQIFISGPGTFSPVQVVGGSCEVIVNPQNFTDVGFSGCTTEQINEYLLFFTGLASVTANVRDLFLSIGVPPDQVAVDAPAGSVENMAQWVYAEFCLDFSTNVPAPSGYGSDFITQDQFIFCCLGDFVEFVLKAVVSIAEDIVNTLLRIVDTSVPKTDFERSFLFIKEAIIRVACIFSQLFRGECLSDTTIDVQTAVYNLFVSFINLAFFPLELIIKIINVIILGNASSFDLADDFFLRIIDLLIAILDAFGKMFGCFLGEDAIAVFQLFLDLLRLFRKVFGSALRTFLDLLLDVVRVIIELALLLFGSGSSDDLTDAVAQFVDAFIQVLTAIFNNLIGDILGAVGGVVGGFIGAIGGAIGGLADAGATFFKDVGGIIGLKRGFPSEFVNSRHLLLDYESYRNVEKIQKQMWAISEDPLIMDVYRSVNLQLFLEYVAMENGEHRSIRDTGNFYGLSVAEQRRFVSISASYFNGSTECDLFMQDVVAKDNFVKSLEDMTSLERLKFIQCFLYRLASGFATYQFREDYISIVDKNPEIQWTLKPNQIRVPFDYFYNSDIRADVLAERIRMSKMTLWGAIENAFHQYRPGPPEGVTFKVDGEYKHFGGKDSVPHSDEALEKRKRGANDLIEPHKKSKVISRFLEMEHPEGLLNNLRTIDMIEAPFYDGECTIGEDEFDALVDGNFHQSVAFVRHQMTALRIREGISLSLGTAAYRFREYIKKPRTLSSFASRVRALMSGKNLTDLYSDITDGLREMQQIWIHREGTKHIMNAWYRNNPKTAPVIARQFANSPHIGGNDPGDHRGDPKGLSVFDVANDIVTNEETPPAIMSEETRKMHIAIINAYNHIIDMLDYYWPYINKIVYGGHGTPPTRYVIIENENSWTGFSFINESTNEMNEHYSGDEHKGTGRKILAVTPGCDCPLVEAVINTLLSEIEHCGVFLDQVQNETAFNDRPFNSSFPDFDFNIETNITILNNETSPAEEGALTRWSITTLPLYVLNLAGVENNNRIIKTVGTFLTNTNTDENAGTVGLVFFLNAFVFCDLDNAPRCERGIGLWWGIIFGLIVFAGFAIILAVWTTVFQFMFASTTFMFLALPFIIMFFSYGYSPLCFPIGPECLAHDVQQILDHFLLQECIEWPPGVVKPPYDADTCPASGGREFFHCAEDIMFYDVIDNIAFLIDWLNPSLADSMKTSSLVPQYMKDALIRKDFDGNPPPVQESCNWLTTTNYIPGLATLIITLGIPLIVLTFTTAVLIALIALILLFLLIMFMLFSEMVQMSLEDSDNFSELMERKLKTYLSNNGYTRIQSSMNTIRSGIIYRRRDINNNNDSETSTASSEGEKDEEESPESLWKDNSETELFLGQKIRSRRNK